MTKNHGDEDGCEPYCEAILQALYSRHQERFRVLDTVK